MEEVAALAAYKQMPLEDFSDQYLKPYKGVPGWRLLSASPTAEVCVFLDQATNQCTVHPARPLQCASYPWWPELMHPRVWKMEREETCEGLDHPDAGPLDEAEAARTLAAATEHTLRLEAAKPAGWDAEQELYGGAVE